MKSLGVMSWLKVGENSVRAYLSARAFFMEFSKPALTVPYNIRNVLSY
jgi:hypothetical protein